MSGSVNEFQPVLLHVQSNDPILKIFVQEASNMFVTHDEFKDVQTDYYVIMKNLEGGLTFIYQVGDSLNYDYVSLNSDGSVVKGRVTDRANKVFEEARHALYEMLFALVVANDTHFRGYINKEMVIHGHGDAPSSGNVGLKINGSG